MERPIRFEHHRFLGDKRTQRRLRPRHLHRHRGDRRADGRARPTCASGPTPCPRPATAATTSRRGTPRPSTASSRPPWSTASPRAGTSSSAHLARPKMRADVTTRPERGPRPRLPERRERHRRGGVRPAGAGRSPGRRDGLAGHGAGLPRAAAGPRGASRSAGGSTTSAPPSTTCAPRRTSAACGWSGSAPAARSPSARPPTTREVRGVASLGAPADFDDWASHPKRLLEHAREVGMIADADLPAPTSTSGPASSRTCGPSPAPAAWRPARCSSCTAATTTSSPSSTPGSSSTPTAPPSSGS